MKEVYVLGISQFNEKTQRSPRGHNTWSLNLQPRTRWHGQAACDITCVRCVFKSLCRL